MNPGRRFMYLMAGNLLAAFPDQAELLEFGAHLARDAREVRTDQLETLLDGERWQERLTAAWLAAFGRRTELRSPITTRLLSEDLHGPRQGYCLALARFGETQDAEILRDYLDEALPTRTLDGPDWALGALLHLDDRNGTTYADALTVPDGPWDAWISLMQINSTFTNPAAEKQRIDQICALAERSDTI